MGMGTPKKNKTEERREAMRARKRARKAAVRAGRPNLPDKTAKK